MELLTARQYRMMAKEMRTLASAAISERARTGLMNAAENYERIAGSLELVEPSRKRWKAAR